MKGPVQLLLYAAIAGLCGGFGWQVYSLWELRTDAEQTRNPRIAQLHKTVDAKLTSAKAEVNSGSQGEVDYNRPQRLWNAFEKANFHGYEEPEKPDPAEQQPSETVTQRPKQPPVEDLLTVVFAVSGNEDSSILTIRYKPEANIEPPEGYAAGLAALSGPGRTGGPRDSVGSRSTSRSLNQGRNNSRSRNANRPTTPRPRPNTFPNSGAATGEYYDLLRIGDSLWEPHQDVTLIAIDREGNATFQRDGEDYTEEEKAPQKIYREVAGLSQAILKRLAEGGFVSTNTPQQVSTASQAQIQQDTGWVETEQTQIFEANGRKRVNLARNDPVLQDARRMFNEEIGAKTISTPGGTKGVQITRLPSNASQYGVQTGDIVLSINGESVSSRTEAVKVSRAQYDRGRRTFEVEFLRDGRRVTQSFVAPEN